MLQQLLRYLSVLPTGEKLDDTQRRIRTLQVFVWMSLWAVVTTGIADVLQAIPPNIYVTGAAIVLISILAVLLKRGAYRLVAYGLMLVLSGLVFYHTVDLGIQLGSFFILFACWWLFLSWSTLKGNTKLKG